MAEASGTDFASGKFDCRPIRITGTVVDRIESFDGKMTVESSSGCEAIANALFAKLSAANRAEAVAIALRKHLLKI